MKELIEDNTMYLSGGEDRKIYALDVKSGSIIRTTAVGGITIYESPIYLDGTLFVSSDLTVGAKLTAFNADDGKKKWTVPLGGLTYFRQSAGDGVLLIGSYDGQKLRGLRIEDGSEVWSKMLVNEGVASKSVNDEGTLNLAGTNFDTGEGTLYAIDSMMGEEKWKSSGIGGTQAGSPIVYENIVVTDSAAKPVMRRTGFFLYPGEG